MHRNFSQLTNRLIKSNERLSKLKKIAVLTVGAGSLIYTAIAPLGLKSSDSVLSTKLGGISRFIR